MNIATIDAIPNGKRGNNNREENTDEPKFFSRQVVATLTVTTLRYSEGSKYCIMQLLPQMN